MKEKGKQEVMVPITVVAKEETKKVYYDPTLVAPSTERQKR